MKHLINVLQWETVSTFLSCHGCRSIIFWFSSSSQAWTVLPGLYWNLRCCPSWTSCLSRLKCFAWFLSWKSFFYDQCVQKKLTPLRELCTKEAPWHWTCRFPFPWCTLLFSSSHDSFGFWDLLQTDDLVPLSHQMKTTCWGMFLNLILLFSKKTENIFYPTISKKKKLNFDSFFCIIKQSCDVVCGSESGPWKLSGKRAETFRKFLARD